MAQNQSKSRFMEIQELLKNYIGNKSEKPLITYGEWQHLVGKFTDKLDAVRKENGFKKLGAKFYSVKMAQSGLKTVRDLYWFYAYCNDAKNFSKCWWWSLKAK